MERTCAERTLTCERACLELLGIVCIVTGERDLAVGIIACLQTHGWRANWHPHLHLLVTARTVTAAIRALTDGGFRADGTFVSRPAHDTVRFTEAFRCAVLRRFVRRDLFDADLAAGMRGRRRHAGGDKIGNVLREVVCWKQAAAGTRGQGPMESKRRIARVLTMAAARLKDQECGAGAQAFRRRMHGRPRIPLQPIFIRAD